MAEQKCVQAPEYFFGELHIVRRKRVFLHEHERGWAGFEGEGSSPYQISDILPFGKEAS